MEPPLANGFARSLTDRYRVRHQIGRGGMASVYLADDLRHHRQVAIKVMRPELAAEVGVDRFLREIRLVAQLQHPHILPLYDSGQAEGLLYFVMPFVDGESLRDRLRQEGRLPLDATARIVRHLADALDYAHERGVVHRDLKPENVLLTSGQALLADFGVARAGATELGETMTGVRMAVGTPAYMSPEQAVGDAAVDGRSDLYGLACLCYEMLTGAQPFVAATVVDVIRQHLTAPPPRLGAADIPPAVDDGIQRALAKQPGDRFGTCSELAAVLEGAMVAARQPSAADRRLDEVVARAEARQRVLVLSFANLTGAPDVDWLCSAIAETVSADLNKIDRLKIVVPDAATRQLAASLRRGGPFEAEDALELGRQTDARWVLWGSFQKVGPRIRLTAWFGDTTGGRVISAPKVDGVIDEIFDLQDRLVTGLTQVIGLDLSTGEVAGIRRPQTEDLTAYEHYARGWEAFDRFGKASVKVAAEHYRQAIALDPDYAQALAGLGILYGPMYIASGNEALLGEGANLLERALGLDDSLGPAYAWLAYMQFRQGRFEESERTAIRGIERDPSSAWGWYMLGIGRMIHGMTDHRPRRLAACVGPLVRAMRLDPGYQPAFVGLCHAYLVRGEYGLATGLADRGLAIERAGAGHQFVGSLVQRAALDVGADRLDSARVLLDQAVVRYTGADHVYAEVALSYSCWLRGCVEERSGRSDRARHAFTTAVDVAEANPHRIGIGAHLVKARLGLARVACRTGEVAAARSQLAAAQALFSARDRFVWTYTMGGSDAEVLYEMAATQAALEDDGSAVRSLALAADAGWADAVWLRHDPAFHALRDREDVRTLCLEAAARVRMPPPAGEGGLE
jgi:eukaryotic-like serine/threonine-protein kinase